MNMKRFHRVIAVSWFATALVCLSIHLSYAQEKVKRTGTFSNLVGHSESGDLLGAEIRIVYSDTGYQAMLQIAEGGAGIPVLVPVSFESHRVKFQIPDSHAYAGSFEGQVDLKSLRGILRFKSDAEMKIDLPRKKSYWD